MKFRLYHFLFCIILSVNLEAQTTPFSKIYFDPWYFLINGAMVNSFDGGTFVCGGSRGGAFIMKNDSLGSVEWIKLNEIGVNDRFNDIIQTYDSCYVLSGTHNYNFVLEKIDQNGNVIWYKKAPFLNHHNPRSIIQTIDNGFFITGYRDELGYANKVFTMKIDSQGEIIWKREYPSNFYQTLGLSAIQTADDGFAVIGTKKDTLGDTSDAFLMKISDLGVVQWTKSYDDSGLYGFFGIDIIDVSDGIISFYNSYPNNFVLKTDYFGNTIWLKQLTGMTGSSSEFGKTLRVQKFDNGNLLYSIGSRGLIPSPPSDIVCIDTSGSVVFSKKYLGLISDIRISEDQSWTILSEGNMLSYFVGLAKADSSGNGNFCLVDDTTITSTSAIFSELSISMMDSLDLTQTIDTSCNVVNIQINVVDGCGDTFNSLVELPNLNVDFYPNPSGEEISFEQENSNTVKLKIFDLSGRIVFERMVYKNTSNVFNLKHDLLPGIYIGFIFSDEKFKTGRIIVQ